MTREQVKIMLPIIKAFAEGKTLQYRVNEETNEWKDIDNPAFNDAPSEYRIKPEPKYRPFKNKEECWNEMLKHQPFGWLKGSKVICHIDEIFCDYINVNGSYLTHSQVFNNYEFFDGTPFGIK